MPPIRRETIMITKLLVPVLVCFFVVGCASGSEGKKSSMLDAGPDFLGRRCRVAHQARYYG